MQLDDIIIKLGAFGTYQKRVYLLASLICIPWAFHAIGSVFLAASTDHWCASPTASFNCSQLGIAEDQCDAARKNYTIPSETINGKLVYEQCERYDFNGDPNETSTTECDAGWIYDRSQYQSTVVQDFNLVCKSKNLAKIADSCYFAGFLVGAFLFGNLNDWIGRYLTFFIGIGTLTTFGTVAAFSPTFTVWAIMRFFIGMTNMAGLSIFILGSEIVGPSKRAMAANVIWMFFSGGYMLLAVIAYFIRDWKTLQLVISVPIVLFFLLIPILCESPRWLISRGKLNQAEKVLRKAAKVNKVELPKVLFGDQEKILEKTEVTVGKPWDLFKTSNLRMKTLNMFFNWFVNNMVYYGLSLSTSGLGVNDYLAAFVSGAVELPAYAFCWFALNKFGRRSPICVFMLIGGAACIIAALIPPGVGRTVVAMIGKFNITASFSVAYLYAGELFPTPVRSIGVGMCSMCARISGVLAPIILILGDHWAPLPFIFFGINSIAAGLLALFLPETHGASLPQTLQEGEDFKRKPIKGNCLTLFRGRGDDQYRQAPTTEAANGVYTKTNVAV